MENVYIILNMCIFPQRMKLKYLLHNLTEIQNSFSFSMKRGLFCTKKNNLVVIFFTHMYTVQCSSGNL